MTPSNNRKRIKISLWFCLPYVIISFFFYHIDKLISSDGISLTVHFILISILVPYLIFSNLALFIIAARELYIAYRCRKRLSREIFFPLFICVASYLIGFMGPLRPSSEWFESKAVYRSYIHGTVSHLTITMRANGRLEINNGAMGLSDYSYGSWRKRGDTIFFKHDDPAYEVKGFLYDTLVVLGDRLNPINNIKDSTGNYFLRQFVLTTKPD